VPRGNAVLARFVGEAGGMHMELQSHPSGGCEGADADSGEQTAKARRRPGPVPMPGMVRTSVYVDLDLLEWAKRRPGGLSETIRRLLREEMCRTKPGAAGGE